MDLFDFSYLTVVGEDLQSWCAKYDLAPKKSKCLHCDNSIETTIPAFGNGWRGLVADVCICGKSSHFRHFVLTSNTELPAFVRMLG